MKVDLHKIDGSKAGKHIDLPESIFGIEPNEHVVYLAVKQFRAAQRQGTHKAKERSDVKGSTRKIKKQKGTGTARAGDIKNPLFRHGGTIFGPRPRDYSFKLNKKVKDLARKSALSAKLRDGEIMIVEDFQLEDHKTRTFIEIMNNLGVSLDKALFLLSEMDPNTALAARNIPNARVSESRSVNTYDLLNADKLVFTESGVKVLIEILEKKDVKATA